MDVQSYLTWKLQNCCGWKRGGKKPLSFSTWNWYPSQESTISLWKSPRAEETRMALDFLETSRFTRLIDSLLSFIFVSCLKLFSLFSPSLALASLWQVEDESQKIKEDRGDDSITVQYTSISLVASSLSLPHSLALAVVAAAIEPNYWFFSIRRSTTRFQKRWWRRWPSDDDDNEDVGASAPPSFDVAGPIRTLAFLSSFYSFLFYI